MTLTYIVLIVFAGAYLIMPLIIRLAKRFVVVDHPADHKIHSDPTPRGGGIALAFAWICGALLLVVFDLGTDSRLVMGLIVGGVVIAVIGLLDDFMEVRPRTKLIGQTVAATAFVAISAPALQLGTHALLAIVWIVFFANAFNLIDGLDGLAAGLAAIAAAQFALLAAGGGSSSILGPSVLLVAACLGFLPYNWRPAKIFMGDTGSLFLGFLLAALATVNFTATDSVSIAAAPLFVIALPVFDTLLTVSRRIVNRESLFMADTNHFYNRLMERGFSHRGSVVFTLALSAILGAGGLALALADATPIWVAAGFVIMGTSLSALVRKYGLIVRGSVLED